MPRGLITPEQREDLIRMLTEIADAKPVINETERALLRTIWRRLTPTTAPEMETVRRIHSRIKKEST